MTTKGARQAGQAEAWNFWREFLLSKKGPKQSINGHYIRQTKHHNTKPIAFHHHQTLPRVLSLGFYAARLFPTPSDLPCPRGTGAPRFCEYSPLGAVLFY